MFLISKVTKVIYITTEMVQKTATIGWRGLLKLSVEVTQLFLFSIYRNKFLRCT